MLKAIFLTTSTIKMRTCGCEHIQISFPKYAKFNSFPERDKIIVIAMIFDLYIIIAYTNITLAN